MQELKKIFEYSSNNVIICNHDFDILWKNKKAEENLAFTDNNCSVLFANYSKPLKSGDLSVRFGGIELECNVISSPDNGGIYIIQLGTDDILFSFFSRKSIREFFQNEEGRLRNSVSGIINSNKYLQSIIDSNGYSGTEKYRDITSGNCCKILRFAVALGELIRYTDKSIVSRKVNFSDIMKKFTENSKTLLGEKIEINSDIEDGLFVNCDPERLEMFLLALVSIIQREGIKNIVDISAKKNGEFISLTVFAEDLGSDYYPGKYSKIPPLFDNTEMNIDRIIVNRFCAEFGGIIFASDNADDSNTVSVKLPLCKDGKKDMCLESETEKYSDSRFSKYNIMYSDIMY